MIQWMHRLSKSWVAVILMGMLGMSFVVWGIADVFTGGSSTAVVTVGRTEIGALEFQRVYRNFLRNQGQQMGTEITPDLAQKMGLANVALQQLVSRTALNNEARRLGLVTSDATVAASVRDMAPFKGPTGAFDRQTFHAAPKPLSKDAKTSDWPRVLGPTDDAISPETHLSKKWAAAEPKTVWEVAMGEGYNSPAISGDWVPPAVEKIVTRGDGHPPAGDGCAMP